jgi:hypothetical protein
MAHVGAGPALSLSKGALTCRAEQSSADARVIGIQAIPCPLGRLLRLGESSVEMKEALDPRDLECVVNALIHPH